MRSEDNFLGAALHLPPCLKHDLFIVPCCPVSIKDSLLSVLHFMVGTVLKLKLHMSVCVGLSVLGI